jgi:hypothetical protein
MWHPWTVEEPMTKAMLANQRRGMYPAVAVVIAVIALVVSLIALVVA